MSELRDHPFIIAVGVIASLIAIFYTSYVFFTGRHSINDKDLYSSEEVSTFISKETKNKSGEKAKPVKSTISKTNTESIAPIEKKVQEQTMNVKAINECNLNQKKFIGKYGYYLKFYGKEGNRFKVIAEIGISDINGTAIIKERTISIQGNYGIGSLEISENCRNVTGFLKGRTVTHSIDFNRN